MDMTIKTVRWTVGALLESKNMSTQQLADAAGITYKTALALRRGVNSEINADLLGKVCTALDCEISDLIVLVDKPDNAPA